ncbi:MAG TPA: ZIP family metal transporter [Methylomirabilota bacterium]|nr:ZIP family metal transporter [Methylomirabilota bacterium]
MRLIWIVGASLMTVAAMLVAAGLVRTAPDRMRGRLLSGLVSYAVGTLMGAAFLALLPEALRAGETVAMLGTVLAGLVLFFTLEKLILWRHCHDGTCDTHRATGPLILTSDGLHNFVDGVVIAGAFLVSVPVGVATAVAVVAHELPQELGDIAVLLDSGYSFSRAVALNTVVSLSTPLGGILAYAALDVVDGAVPYVLALAAAGFIYIAAADLIPALHRRAALTAGVSQVVLIVAGIGTIAVLEWVHP